MRSSLHAIIGQRVSSQQRPSDAQLSIVLPAFNEAKRLPRSLASIHDYFSGHNGYEVIVVSDGSTDGTEQILQDWQVSWPELRVLAYQPNRGKGHAVREGVLASIGDSVLIFDADGATPISEWPKLKAALREGADMALGSRRSPGSLIERAQPLRRRMMGATLSLLTRVIFGLPVRDTQCGFKLFRGRVAREVFAASTRDGWDFDLEILLVGQSLGCRIREVGVRWLDEPDSKVRALRDGCRFLYSLAVLFWRFRLRPNLCLSAKPRSVYHVP